MIRSRVHPSPGLHRRPRRRGGFTLVEVLITIVFMAIIVPVAMRGMSVSLFTAGRAQRTAEAATLGQMILDDLIVQYDPTLYPTSGDFGEDFPNYTWQMQSTYDAEFLMTQYTINVYWSERAESPVFSTSTFLADPPLVEVATQ